MEDGGCGGIVEVVGMLIRRGEGGGERERMMVRGLGSW